MTPDEWTPDHATLRHAAKHLDGWSRSPVTGRQEHRDEHTAGVAFAVTVLGRVADLYERRAQSAEPDTRESMAAHLDRVGGRWACDPKSHPPHVWPVPLARHADPAAAALEAAERGIGQVRRLLAAGVPDPVGCRAALVDLLAASEHLTALWALRGEPLRATQPDWGSSRPASESRSPAYGAPRGPQRHPEAGPEAPSDRPVRALGASEPAEGGAGDPPTIQSGSAPPRPESPIA